MASRQSDPQLHQDCVRRPDQGDRVAAGGGDDVHRRGLCGRDRGGGSARPRDRFSRGPGDADPGGDGARGDALGDGAGADRRGAEGDAQAPLPRRARAAGGAGAAALGLASALPPSPGPLRGPRRRVLRPLPFEERQAASNPSERLLRGLAAAVAEKGYPETTIADIIERAGTSYRAFYELFQSKEDAIVAALDVGSLQMLAAALPAFRIAKDWPEAVRATQEAMFLYGVQEPEYARLGAVEMYAAGTRALEQRERVTEQMEALLAAGYELAPEIPSVTAEAIGGALTRSSMNT